jgi:hypothetical protein
MYICTLLRTSGQEERGDSHDAVLTIVHDRMGKEFLTCIVDYMSGRDVSCIVD